jgi:hypothetical protein
MGDGGGGRVSGWLNCGVEGEWDIGDGLRFWHSLWNLMSKQSPDIQFIGKVQPRRLFHLEPFENRITAIYLTVIVEFQLGH